jgi:DnaK suppressor protein
MHPSTQETFRPVIDARLAEIAVELDDAVDSSKPVVPDVSVGRLSRMDSMQMQQIALASKRRLEDERGRLQEARRRIDAGTYGRCSQCGLDIAEERLRNQPDASTCIPCLTALRAQKGR